MSRRILSISYGQSQMEAREKLMSYAGYEIRTASDLTDAIKHCTAASFDLVIVASNVSEKNSDLFPRLREHCKAPVLALCDSKEHLMTFADFHCDSGATPAEILRTVAEVLFGRTKIA
jgi:DNA-binding response OmpR family regulator